MSFHLRVTLTISIRTKSNRNISIHFLNIQDQSLVRHSKDKLQKIMLSPIALKIIY